MNENLQGEMVEGVIELEEAKLSSDKHRGDEMDTDSEGDGGHTFAYISVTGTRAVEGVISEVKNICFNCNIIQAAMYMRC